jgi:uncharacterized protein
MSIDWLHFTPWSALFGGLLIGTAAAALILCAGRIMGAAGILGGALALQSGDIGWRLSLIAGLLLSPSLLALFGAADRPRFDASWPLLIVAGLMVGFGARLGSGCTSGHGVCGISRLSPRSFVATALFVLVAFATVGVARHVVG